MQSWLQPSSLFDKLYNFVYQKHVHVYNRKQIARPARRVAASFSNYFRFLTQEAFKGLMISLQVEMSAKQILKTLLGQLKNNFSQLVLMCEKFNMRQTDDFLSFSKA